MAELANIMAQRTAAQKAVAEGAPPPQLPEGAAAELELYARMAIALDKNSAELARSRAAGRIPWEACHPVPLNPITLTAAGNVNDERWEPRGSWVWHITRISVQSNAAGGATSALAIADSANMGGATNLQSFPPPGSVATAGSFLGCWEPKGLFMMPGSRILMQGTGGGITANGQAIEIALDWLATYLM
jgi:hypothetical protein